MNLKGIVRSLARRGRDTDDSPVEMHSALDDWLGRAQELKGRSRDVLDVVSLSEGESREDVKEVETVNSQDMFWKETVQRSEAAFHPFVTILEEMDVQELMGECREVVALLGARQYYSREDTD